jgi:hypothetical protein
MRAWARRVAAVTVFALPALMACTSDDNALPFPTGDAGQLLGDASLPSCASSNLGCLDASEPDVTVPTDTGTDSTVLDSSPPENDANVPDAADAAAADAADASDAATPDANDANSGVVPDAATPDASDAATVDASDAAAGPPQCAVDVESDYYIRASGTVVYHSGTTNTEIVIAGSSTPLEPVSQVFTNAYSACALRSSDGTVWCWPTFGSGNNSDGSLGNGTFIDSTNIFGATQVEIAAPDGGAVVYLDQVTSLATGSTAGSPGHGTSGNCAIRSDKTLWCWGDATEGYLWQGTTGSTNNLAFATKMEVIVDGGVMTDGGGADFENVDQVSMGGRHACFLSAGNAYCWGDNTSSELGAGDTTRRPNPYQVTTGLPGTAISTVTAGSDQSCVLVSGDVYCWGADTDTCNGNPFVTRNICNSNYCNWTPVPVQVALPDGGSNAAPLTGIQTLFGGVAFSCAIDGSGTLYCWGASTGTPTLVTEATIFTSSGSGVPSSPIAKVTGSGEGFSTQLRYLTTGGVYVDGTQVATQVCP